MIGIMKNNNAQMGIVLTILAVALPLTLGDPVIPADIAKVESWFTDTIKPVDARKADLEPNLVTAEASPVLVKVRQDGSGDFKTVQAAIDAVKLENKVRTIIDIGPGVYTEKIKVERFKPYITFLGDPKDNPTLAFHDTAKEVETIPSSSVTIEADYFTAYNIIFKNTAPRPTLQTIKGQAVALDLAGEKATLYNCRLIGFQDTLCDNVGKHFFKDTYIEGTVDFIFGSGQSIYLNCEIHVIPGDQMAMVTAQANNNAQDKGGYSFVHCNVTGEGRVATLGRSWMPAPKVVFIDDTLSEAVSPAGWSDNRQPDTDKTVFFGEFQNTGPGADLSNRVPFMKKFTDADAKPFITLEYIEGTKWILPPPEAKGGPLGSGAPGAAPGASAPGAAAPGAPAGAAAPK